MVRQCSQCGATVELAEHVLSTTCSFCDSPLVEVDAEREPVDRLVPFDVPRDRAARLLRGYLAGHWLAPERLRKAARAEEIRQVFVPFYCYDAVARSEWSCRCGVYWYRTETYTVTVNGRTQVRTRQVRETEWFPLSGTHARRWFDHLVSASRGISEPEANALEPFDLGRSLPFAPALAAGVQAEHPTVPHDEAEAVACQELDALQKRVITSSHLPGDTHRSLQCTSDLAVEQVRLVLLPVWMAVFKGPKDTVRLLVNGQTGEVVGVVPRSSWKVGCVIAGLLALLATVVLLMLAAGGFAALLEAL